MVYVPGVLAEKLISTVSAGKHAAGGAGTLIQGFHLGAGDGRAAGVDHHAGNRAISRLGKHQCAARQHTHHQHQGNREGW